MAGEPCAREFGCKFGGLTAGQGSLDNKIYLRFRLSSKISLDRVRIRLFNSLIASALMTCLVRNMMLAHEC